MATRLEPSLQAVNERINGLHGRFFVGQNADHTKNCSSLHINKRRMRISPLSSFDEQSRLGSGEVNVFDEKKGDTSEKVFKDTERHKLVVVYRGSGCGVVMVQNITRHRF